ncbi:hypothetical protein Scep_024116 [Stephania cephalantha]|uniref:Uncharacterized protein n=1 Tax=Stephania cephalantha TaxID=152367 RepID=A0AAP0EVY7_9MAGN
MAVSSNNEAAEAPLLVEETMEGIVDYNGQKARRLSSGGWHYAGFIIGVEIAEKQNEGLFFLNLGNNA